ncbi:MAG: type I-E CRISPR-associated endoribonuclease Cas2e [Coriobacteriia bacterium]|nr:type I-E CRISPR-associated endoribonuclease Cas2e [Coriobacteriia bacterium]
MIVITVSDCPIALRGDLTKWLFEINTGVYVGRVSARVRENIWDRVKDSIKQGRATMVYSAQNEQGMNFRVHNCEWEPIDFDGVKLMLRPSSARVKKLGALRLGFSNASRRRKWK